ncbi:hypothetical protein C2I17_02005 [Niallia circulans]|uniref:Uncharacterized protein n=1 Tax=Niallia circulans TaxID=1397 RepID=A0AA91TVL2_NIACI|nr:hypothetical protein CHH57_05500 [Niallia circulans]UQZ73426.1 hypothetical protein C2I17_02005 [Niallia circulans]
MVIPADWIHFAFIGFKVLRHGLSSPAGSKKASNESMCILSAPFFLLTMFKGWKNIGISKRICFTTKLEFVFFTHYPFCFPPYSIDIHYYYLFMEHKSFNCMY